MFQLRLVLEDACVAAAIRDATDEDLERLDEFRAYDGGDDQSAFIRYNTRFHTAIADCSANARMAEVTRNLIEHMDRLVLMSLAVDRSHGRDHERLVKEHRTIIDTIQNRDKRRARQLTKRHIGSAEKRVMTAPINGI